MGADHRGVHDCGDDSHATGWACLLLIDNYILPGDLPGLLRIAPLMLVIYWLHACSPGS